MLLILESKYLLIRLRILIIIFLAALIFIGYEKQSGQADSSNLSKVEKEKIIFAYGKNGKEVVFNFPSVKEPEFERKWKSLKPVFRWQLGGIENEVFLYPSQVKTDENGNVYVLDNQDCSIKKFDENGIFQRKYGQKGKGPGEFDNAFDFDIIGDGKIVAISPNLNKFVVFNNEDIIEYKPTDLSLNLCFATPEEVVILQMMDPISKSPLRKINYLSNQSKDCKNFLNEESFGGEAYGMLPFIMGDVHRYRSNKIIYASQILGYIIIYNETGEIEKAFRLLERNRDKRLANEKERIRRTNKSMVAFPSDDEYLFYYSNVSENNLYVLANDMDKEKYEYTVDVYSLSDCEYTYSFLLKGFGELESAYFTNDDFYIVKTSTQVEAYNYSIE